MVFEDADASRVPTLSVPTSLPPLIPRDTPPEKPAPRLKLRYTEKPKFGVFEPIATLPLKPHSAEPPPLAGAWPLAAAAAERLVAPAAESLLNCQAEPELPEFGMGLPNAAPAGGRSFEAWKPLPAAPAERISAAHGVAVVSFAGFSSLQPVMGALALADPIAAMLPRSQHIIPEPRIAEAIPRTAGPMRTIAVVGPAAHTPDAGGYFLDGPEPAAPTMPDAESAQSMATPVYGRAQATPPMRLPLLGEPVPNQGLQPAAFASSIARPAAKPALPRPITPAPLSTVSVRQPQQPEPAQPVSLRMGELVPLEFFCSRGPRTAAHAMGWIIPAISVTAPRFVAPLSVEHVAPLPAAPKEKRKRPAFAEIFTLPEASRRSTVLRDLSKMIAACLVIGALLWYGVSYIRSNHDAAMGTLSADGGQNLPAENAPAARANPESQGLFSRVRFAISRRAETHLGDSFDTGMAAWGAPPNSWSPGWTRSAEGYVTPGKLALFQPTLQYTDYRLEFFGQIESKSLNWAVRASDSANYYGMKFAAAGPGPRAVVSMIHYSVVAGKKGPRVATALGMMIHEHTPYHVEVDVRGDQVTTSIEGQEVDRFVDGALARGGVGFFAEAGEQARLYWIKVSRNEDWLGRVCAFLNGSGSATAQLWPPAGTLPRPGPSAPDPTNQLALAAGFGLMRANAFRRISDDRRFRTWRS